MPDINSEKGEIPEIDPNNFDTIISLVTTFESNDLHTKNAINFRYDKKSDYVFMDILSMHNGMKLADCIFGFDKEKIINTCHNILGYFNENLPSRN